MTDIEKLKQELKAELLDELKAEASKKSIPGLEAVRKKWFNGPDRIWDAVRGITRIIFGMKSQTRLSTVDQKKA